MTNRRHFLKACAAVTACTAQLPAFALDQSYQIAVDKIWRYQNTDSNSINARNLTLPNISTFSREWVRMAILAASSHNSQPWKFKLEANLITIFPDYQRRCPIVDPDDSHLFKSLGCAAENVVQAAAYDGYIANVRFDPALDAVLIDFDQTNIIQHNNLAAAIANRRCSRTVYDGGPLESPLQKVLMNAASSSEITPLFLQSKPQIETMLEYVRQGDIAQYDDARFVKELSDWIRFNPTDAIVTGDGLATEITGQTQLPSWLGKRIINLFLTGKAQADIDAKAIRSSAGIIVFIGERDDKASWVAAGRAYQKFALQTTALNVRNALINQPIEVRSLRPQLHAWLGLQKQYVHLIARYGRGPNAAHSLRRPLEAVIL
ncbi:MAG: twin-arginine translocation signal domain-containing protein [Methylophilus sp.]